MISYEDFKKVDMKIGTVVSAEPHPDADRLMVLKVDLGDQEKQVVAGLKEYYSFENIVGKQVVIAANLESVKLCGVESHGMVLAAEDSKGNVCLLTTDKNVENGARVL